VIPTEQCTKSVNFLKTITAHDLVDFDKNIQREDVHPYEEALGFAQLVNKGMDAQEIALCTAKSLTLVRQRLMVAQCLIFEEEMNSIFSNGLDEAPLVNLEVGLVDGKINQSAIERLIQFMRHAPEVYSSTWEILNEIGGMDG
jgi:hemerythrin-like domain-containing protein